MPCVAEQAWVAMKYGSNLHAQAKRFGVDAGCLDRAIWIWRGRVTRSLPSEGAVVVPRVVARLAS